MSKTELMKLYYFILENKNIIIDKNGLFNRDTLTWIRIVIKRKMYNNFELTSKEKEFLIDTFIKSLKNFTDKIPDFILENEECIRKAIDNNIYNVNYTNDVPSNIQNFIIKILLEKNYVLSDESPSYLKSNYDIALNSIKLGSSSTDCINWSAMTKDETDKLVEEAVNNGYILSDKSCDFLTKNKKIALQSIKKEINKLSYVNESLKYDYDIFKYILLNVNESEYENYFNYFNSVPLTNLLDSEVMEYYFRKNGMFVASDFNPTYSSRLTKLYVDAFATFPTVKTFESVFQMVAEERWKTYRSENSNDYENPFGKICTQLRNCNDFDSVIINLHFIFNMEEELGEKYAVLISAMKEYFKIIHSDMNNKLERIQSSQDKISKLCALYIAKSKEHYKKNELEDYYEWIKPYFTLKLDNPIIDKKVIQRRKKEKFRKLYVEGDEEINKFIDDLVEQYSELLDQQTARTMVYKFVVEGYSKLDNFIKPPFNYKYYDTYKKANKLIHRLNSGYIKYDGEELINYRDVIELDDKNNKYVYTGKTFDEKTLEAFNEYHQKVITFSMIKWDIISKIKTIENEENINFEDELKSLSKELPFTDEYFVFNSKYSLDKFRFKDLLSACFHDNYSFEVKSFLSDEAYPNIYDAVVNNGLMWLLSFMHENPHNVLEKNEINEDSILRLIDNMSTITKIAKEFHYNLSNYAELSLVNEMSLYADIESIAILGKEIFEKIYKSVEYDTLWERVDTVSAAKELVCQMAKRSKSTVPYVRGQYMNLKYSIYDPHDETILLAGINTNACFRVNGYDNDFFHYCALDKNGFVIKITDSFDNFIGRASGFRNGNCVFINQLRTVYDEAWNNYTGLDKHERNDIIETFKKACEDIIFTSHNNRHEKNKINHVFVTKSYALVSYPSNVSSSVAEKIGKQPMDNRSEDWKAFVENTENLAESVDEDYFETDYGGYPLICMASSKKNMKLRTIDIKLKDVEALYERKRNKIIITTEQNQQIINKINKINGIKSFFDETEFKQIEIPNSSIILVGDNWYMVVNDGNIVSSCVQDFDNKAQIEFKVAKETLNQYVLNGKEQADINSIIAKIQLENSKNYVKGIKFNAKK